MRPTPTNALKNTIATLLSSVYTEHLWSGEPLLSLQVDVLVLNVNSDMTCLHIPSFAQFWP